MPVTFVKGDFLNERPQGEPRAYACPVDIAGTADAGIASAVAKRWPGFAEWWSQQKKQLGDIAVFEPPARDGGGRDVIFALVIQRSSKRSKLSWLDRAIRSLLTEATKRSISHINIPRVWGGASGLDGARAKRIIDDAAMPAPIQVTVFEQFVRAPEPGPSERILPDAPESEVAPKPKKKKAASKKKKTAAATPKKKATAKKKAAAAPKKKAATKKKAAAAPAKKKSAAKKSTAKKGTSKKK